jgi:hypothetical protein
MKRLEAEGAVCDCDRHGLPLELDEAVDVLQGGARVWVATTGRPRYVVVVVDVAAGRHERRLCHDAAAVQRLQRGSPICGRLRA